MLRETGAARGRVADATWVPQRVRAGNPQPWARSLPRSCYRPEPRVPKAIDRGTLVKNW